MAKGLRWTIFCPNFTKTLQFLCSLAIKAGKHLKLWEVNLAAASFSNGLGLGIGFYVYFSGHFRDPSESHKPILLISEKLPIYTDGWVKIQSYYHLEKRYKIDNLYDIWTMYTCFDKGWRQSKFVPSNPHSYSPGHTVLQVYLYTQSKKDACIHVCTFFSLCCL